MLGCFGTENFCSVDKVFFVFTSSERQKTSGPVTCLSTWHNLLNSFESLKSLHVLLKNKVIILHGGSVKLCS